MAHSVRPQAQNRTYLFAILVLVISLFPLWAACHRWQFLNDDAYITLTYSKSIAAGRGFVFNHPPPTLGTTTPLFTLVVATLAIILPWAEISQIAVVFTAFCWIGIVWTVYLGRRSLGLTEGQAVIIGLVIIVSGWITPLGMEAHLFEFLLVLSIVLYFCKQWIGTGVVVGFLFLTRGEGILLLLVFVLHNLAMMWIKDKRLVRGAVKSSSWMVLGCLVVVLVWSLYAWFTFDHVLPNTLSAKLAEGQTGHWSTFMFRLLNEWMPTWENQFALPCCPRVNLWWLLVATGLVYVLLKKRKWLIFLAWIGMYVAGYTVLRVSAYWWYQLPIRFVLYILAAFGLVGISEVLVAKARGKFRMLGYIVAILLVATVAFLLIRPGVVSTLHYEGDSRAPSYLALTDWIRKNTRPSQSVAFVEVGYLGYYADNRIVDLLGLVTPNLVPHVARGDFAWGFWNHEPDYFIYLPDFDWALANIRNDPRFDQLYKAVATVPGPRNTDFTIYAREAGSADIRPNCEMVRDTAGQTCWTDREQATADYRGAPDQ
jgi:hypothetical protein